MHREFIPKLRSDGMGIDYSTIKYKHKGQDFGMPSDRFDESNTYAI